MQLAKGYVGARWLASDPNGDSLIYTVEIRGASETEWKPLKDRVAEKYISWDSTAFPDGEYRLRITASDAPAQSALGGADGAHGERRVLDRQHASEDHGSGRHAHRRQAGSPLARRGRAE